MNWRYPFEPDTRITWAGFAPHDETNPRWVWWLEDWAWLVLLGAALFVVGYVCWELICS